MQSIQTSQYEATQKITLRKVLILLFYVHLLILFFQFLLRDIIIDITIWRDICIILVSLIWLFSLPLLPKKNLLRFSSLDVLIILFIFYGVVNFGINALSRSTFIDAFTYFRNHFFPILMYFPAKYAFSNTSAKKKFIKFLFIIFIIYVTTPIIEAFIKAVGLSLSWIPWYHYSFNHGDRFEGNSDTGYIKIEDSPILGLLGYPHYTVVPIVAIFALIYPFLFPANSKKLQNQSYSLKLVSTPVMKYVYIFLMLCTILIFKVRTHIVIVFLILFLFAPKQIRKAKYLVIALILFPVLFFLFSLMMNTSIHEIYEQFIIGFINDSSNEGTSLAAILSFNDIIFLINSNLYNLLFGHGYEVINATSFELIANSMGWEIQILYYTAVYGLIWLFLFIYINVIAFSFIKSNVKEFGLNSFEGTFSCGFRVMLIVFLIDAGHYMRMMSWPNFDLWIILLAILSSIRKGNFNKFENRTEIVPLPAHC